MLIDRPNKLAFTWVWDHDPSNPQMIELDFTERNGRTTVVMINSRIPTDEMRNSQTRGWQPCYDNLDPTLPQSSS
jgi:uncharacterized protein YndB with AHSA1/START domain